MFWGRWFVVVVGICLTAAEFPSHAALARQGIALEGTVAFSATVLSDTDVCATDGAGPPVRLTDSPARDHSAEWSPDGTRFTFVSDRDGNPEIYLAKADGSAVRRLTTNGVPDANPTWSPDGREVLFARNGDLYAVDTETLAERRITFDPSAGEFSPDWSPDGQTIVFDDDARDGTADNGGIYTTDSNGANPRALGGGFEPAWSSDGRQIAIRSDWFAVSIDVMSSDGSGRRPLTTSGEYEFLHRWPAWSPDGSMIVYVKGDYYGSGSLVLVDVSTGEERELLGGTMSLEEPTWTASTLESSGGFGPCFASRHEREINFRLRGHLRAVGRLTSTSPSCGSEAPVNIQRRREGRWRVVASTITDDAGRYEVDIRDEQGTYRATALKTRDHAARVDCLRERSVLRTHAHH